MSEKKKLMADFPPVSTETWKKAIEVDLKGADYEKRLVWKTLEGFSVEPFYRAEDMANLKHLGGKAGQFPYVNGTKACNSWRVRQTLAVDNPAGANKEALYVLERGVDSLGFKVSKDFSAKDLDTLLKDIDLTAVEVAFSGCGAATVAKLFIEKAERENINKEEVRAKFHVDPLGKASRKGKFCQDNSCCDVVTELIKMADNFPRVKVLSVGAELFNMCGSNAVQELGFALAMGHEYIVQMIGRGLTIDQVAPSIGFNFAVGSNYFMEIAKFRAARMLWANIVKEYKPECDCSMKMSAHATTSAWNMTIYDPYVNMLRNTTESMSAAIAGVDSLEVLPFDTPFAQPNAFSSRIARNTQLLLKEESHFDQVVDPSAGSYYIETLTDKVAQAAWALFNEVESKGGYSEALKAGFIQSNIEETSAKRNKNIATRRETLLGTNQFPNFSEVADKEITEAMVTPGACCKSCGCAEDSEFAPLVPRRGAMEFEAMRLKTDRVAKRPKAFMLTCGKLAFARARAQFSCNYFACAGFEVVDNTYFASVEEGAKAARDAKADIVVICSSDDDYATVAVEANKLLAGSGAIVVVAGAPESRPELEKAGLTHYISARDNVYETLKQYQTELGIQ